MWIFGLAISFYLLFYLSVCRSVVLSIVMYLSFVLSVRPSIYHSLKTLFYLFYHICLIALCLTVAWHVYFYLFSFLYIFALGAKHYPEDQIYSINLKQRIMKVNRINPDPSPRIISLGWLPSCDGIRWPSLLCLPHTTLWPLSSFMMSHHRTLWPLTPGPQRLLSQPVGTQGLLHAPSTHSHTWEQGEGWEKTCKYWYSSATESVEYQNCGLLFVRPTNALQLIGSWILRGASVLSEGVLLPMLSEFEGSCQEMGRSVCENTPRLINGDEPVVHNILKGILWIIFDLMSMGAICAMLSFTSNNNLDSSLSEQATRLQ